MLKLFSIDAQTWDKVKEEGRNRLKGLKSWSDFFDKSRFKLPKDLGEFSNHVKFNLSYFQNNYILVTLIVIAYFLITEPLLLFSVVFVIGGFKFISALPANQPTKIGSASITQTQLWIGYGIVSFILLFFTGVSYTLFWVAVCCAATILIHAGSLTKPIESEFESADENV